MVLRETCPGLVLNLGSIDLEQIADALADQNDYDHHWLINPDTGEIVLWTADSGIDGQTPRAARNAGPTARYRQVDR